MISWNYNTATFLKKEALAQVFSCEFCEISKNTFFTKNLWATASILTCNGILFLKYVYCFLNFVSLLAFPYRAFYYLYYNLHLHYCLIWWIWFCLFGLIFIRVFDFQTQETQIATLVVLKSSTWAMMTWAEKFIDFQSLWFLRVKRSN